MSAFDITAATAATAANLQGMFVLRLRCPYPVHSVRPVSLFNGIARLCVPSSLIPMIPLSLIAYV